MVGEESGPEKSTSKRAGRRGWRQILDGPGCQAEDFELYQTHMVDGAPKFCHGMANIGIVGVWKRDYGFSGRSKGGARCHKEHQGFKFGCRGGVDTIPAFRKAGK